MSASGAVRAGVTLVLWSCVAGAALLRGQDTPETTNAPITTLHVFVDLAQVPVLVLNDKLEPVKNIERDQFTVSVDSGPAAHPSQVRVEGDDPIALAVFLDMESRQGVMSGMGGALAALAPAELHPTDRVTLYSLECRLYQSLNFTLARPALLKDGVASVLSARTQTNGGSSRCSGRVYLWDAIYHTLQQLSAQAGRRVLIVVSDGWDGGSQHSWIEVRSLAQSAGIAIFGINEDAEQTLDVFGNHIPGAHSEAEKRFGLVCGLSGGLVLAAGRDDIAEQVARILTMIRSRYIMEFSRPRQNGPGKHELLVKVAHGHTYVRPSGVSYSVLDPAVGKGSMTVSGPPE